MKIRILGLLIFICILSAQESSTKMMDHFPLFSTLVQTDMMEGNKGSAYTIGVLFYYDEDDSYDHAQRLQLSLMNEIIKLKQSLNKDVTFKLIKYTNKGKLFLNADNDKVDIFYVCEEFPDDEIKKIKFVADKLQILTFTPVNDFYDEGLASTVVDDNNVFSLLINNESVKKERPTSKIDFSTIAKVE